MNCRRVSSLLSAFLDAELTGTEMLDIRAHLDRCTACREEYQSLRETKHLLSSLALQAPRAGFEARLRGQAGRAAQPANYWLPSWVLAWQEGALGLPRPSPFATAAALSLATLLMAAGSLEPPVTSPETSVQALAPATYSPLPEQSSVYASLPRAKRSSLDWQPGGSSIVLLSYHDNR